MKYCIVKHFFLNNNLLEPLTLANLLSSHDVWAIRWSARKTHPVWEYMERWPGRYAHPPGVNEVWFEWFLTRWTIPNSSKLYASFGSFMLQPQWIYTLWFSLKCYFHARTHAHTSGWEGDPHQHDVRFECTEQQFQHTTSQQPMNAVSSGMHLDGCDAIVSCSRKPPTATYMVDGAWPVKISAADTATIHCIKDKSDFCLFLSRGVEAVVGFMKKASIQQELKWCCHDWR